jgi:hypothetical protein
MVSAKISDGAGFSVDIETHQGIILEVFGEVAVGISGSDRNLQAVVLNGSHDSVVVQTPRGNVVVSIDKQKMTVRIHPNRC